MIDARDTLFKIHCLMLILEQYMSKKMDYSFDAFVE